MTLATPIPLEEAQAHLIDLARPLTSEIVPVEEAAGRYLAADIIARRSQPSGDLSAMDGFAVHGANLAGPWHVIGESAAGHPFEGSLAAGEAVSISTGALLPHGAGAILIQENSALEGKTLCLAGSDAATSAYIRRAGFDFAMGDKLLESGSALGPAQLALAIASGHATLSVGRRAKLCVIDSGDELASDPTNVAPHQVPASNRAMIAALAAPFAANCQGIGPVADEKSALIAAFERTGNAEIIVTSGGASVGDHDLVRPALEEWGATLDFWRIAMKPGKPLMVARKGTQIVLGLPGNPVSSYVTAFFFLLPLLRHLAGAREPMPQSLSVPLSEPIAQTGPRTEFIRAQMANGSVCPLAQRDSSALRTLAASNALIMRQAGTPAAKAGEAVLVYPLQNGGIA
ncbi:molybdopterin molybdotransferase MoeA [Aurantiacibacter marinus]|uniref:Molybdopterin molybdenumtransferase n=1 Tax=Aurantiacibacter marinus TaxID=874156 RepID=A0A0H0XPU2_9SPHN|nr:molybdopterin molybdotransferase MoeA [Aurantiacibacter marinus]KLI63952.1 hypothetical protein AAV99_09695 [Aurantiacibacter marinus]